MSIKLFTTIIDFCMLTLLILGMLDKPLLLTIAQIYYTVLGFIAILCILYFLINPSHLSTYRFYPYLGWHITILYEIFVLMLLVITESFCTFFAYLPAVILVIAVYYNSIYRISLK